MLFDFYSLIKNFTENKIYDEIEVRAILSSCLNTVDDEEKFNNFVCNFLMDGKTYLADEHISRIFNMDRMQEKIEWTKLVMIIDHLLSSVLLQLKDIIKGNPELEKYYDNIAKFDFPKQLYNFDSDLMIDEMQKNEELNTLIDKRIQMAKELSKLKREELFLQAQILGHEKVLGPTK